MMTGSYWSFFLAAFFFITKIYFYEQSNSGHSFYGNSENYY